MDRHGGRVDRSIDRRRLLGLTVGVAAASGVAAEHRAAAQTGTPTAASEAGSLPDLLGMVPDVLAGPTPPQYQIAMYANPAVQLETLGIAVPASIDDDEAMSPWIRANSWTVLPDPIRTRSLNEAWRPTFGFDVFDVDQSLVVGEPPAFLTVYRGRFDLDELRAAWTASGFQAVDVAGAEAYSFREEAEVDPSSVVSQLALAQMNNVAVLPDRALLFAPTLDALRSMVAAAQGAEPSLMDRGEVAALVSALDPSITNAFLVPGGAFVAPSVADLNVNPRVTQEQIEAYERLLGGEGSNLPPMPRILFGALATTAGGPLPQPPDEPPATPAPGMPLAHSLVALLMEDRAAAEAAIPIVDTRLAEGTSLASPRPYTDSFSDWELSVAGAEPVLLVDLTPSSDATPGSLFQLLFQRDLIFVAWQDADATPEAG